MRKRTYRAVTVKQLDMAQLSVGHDRLILGCDAAKEIWYGAWMNPQGEVLQPSAGTKSVRRGNC